MKFVSKVKHRGDGSGVVWPDTGSTSVNNIRDPFGPRPFSPHIPTVGYDYDFHRGVDVVLDQGDPIYCPINGTINRLHWTYFWWERELQLDQWEEVDSAGSFSFERVAPSTLRITGSRVGSQTFPTNTGRMQPVYERIISEGSDWTIQVNFSSAPSTNGKVGIGVLDEVNNEFAALEYDGSEFLVRGTDSGGAFGVDTNTVSVSDKTWMRIEYISASGAISWRHSDDGSAWDYIATESSVSFTEGARAVFKPLVYWKSTDTDPTPDTVDIDKVEWNDGQTIGRFGNWMQVVDENKKFVHVHFQDFDVSLGAVVVAGQELGRAGLTGFDQRSGRILAPHVHIEYIPNNKYFYANEDPENPLRDGILPRANNVDNNVSVSRTTENDPDGNPSWKLNITVSREDQDFDVNQVSLTGNLATRTINFDSRSGLNSDVDVPKNNGVYIVPQDFDENSINYVFAVYFDKSVVGSTFSSAEVRDSSGTILWNE